ncbi:hypothetical protein IC229_27450 [Spirosoma sp. BT702]|uniref:Uncharacterized protein n=1 Tax=Spirosoma profusum TaxID=2771354 RepID=A0A926Y0V7_9BACT|nr:hypothetical protein [Spirosoma profusum]MBD2704407.1 hypothetical protein [Spirosoma profusum]
MDVSAIYQVVCQWYDTGILPESDKPAILAAYTEVTGLIFDGSCKKCQLSEVQHALRYHFIKVLNLPSMVTQKWMLRKDVGHIQLHGQAFAYINKTHGPESESAKHLTDEVAEKFMKDDPSTKELFVVNPDFDPQSTTTKSPAKPATKPAATPKAKPAKPAAKPETPTEPVTPVEPVTTPTEPVAPTE